MVDQAGVVATLSEVREDAEEMEWVVLRNRWPLVRGHLLLVNDYGEVARGVSSRCLDRIEYVVFARGPPVPQDGRFGITVLTSRDCMRDFRRALRSEFGAAYFGLLFTTGGRPAAYALTKEWLVSDVSAVMEPRPPAPFFDPPHVVVFDMDSTLITEEARVRIRDPAVHEGLEALRRRNCLLVLWSYGDREHVVHSLRLVGLDDGVFQLVLAEGRRPDGAGEDGGGSSVDPRYDVVYTDTAFHLNVADRPAIPKSPRVVLWHLHRVGVDFIKTLTLVDDLADNDYAYDEFVHIARCPVPVEDWHLWQAKIEEFLSRYERGLGIGE